MQPPGTRTPLLGRTLVATPQVYTYGAGNGQGQSSTPQPHLSRLPEIEM